jgi:hypothetical protein
VVSIVHAFGVLSDVDSPNLGSLAITLTNRPDGTSESLAVDTTGTSLTGSYDLRQWHGGLSLSVTRMHCEEQLDRCSRNGDDRPCDSTPNYHLTSQDDQGSDSGIVPACASAHNWALTLT